MSGTPILGSQGLPMVAAQEAAQTLDGGAAAQLLPPLEVRPAPFNAATYDWMGPIYRDLPELYDLYVWMAKNQDTERWTCFSTTVPDHWLENKLRTQVLRWLASSAGGLTVEWVQAYADNAAQVLRVECDMYRSETLSGAQTPRVKAVNAACAALGKTTGPHTLARWWRCADHYARKQALDALLSRQDDPNLPEQARPSSQEDLSDELVARWRRMYVIEVPAQFQSRQARPAALRTVQRRFGRQNYTWVNPVYAGGNALVLLDMGEPCAAALRMAVILTRTPDRWEPQGHKAEDFLRVLAREDYWYEAHVAIGVMYPDQTGDIQAVVRVVDRLALHEIPDRIVPVQTNADPHAWRVPPIVTRWLYAWWRGVFVFARTVCPHSFVLATMVAYMARVRAALLRDMSEEQHIVRMVVCNSGACERDPRTKQWTRLNVTKFVQWLWEADKVRNLRIPFYQPTEGERFSHQWNPVRASYPQWLGELEAAGGSQMLREMREALVEARYAPKDPSSPLYGLSDDLDLEPPSGPGEMFWLADARSDAWGISHDSDLGEDPIDDQAYTLAAWTEILDAYFEHLKSEVVDG